MKRAYKCIASLKQAGWVKDQTYMLEEAEALEAVQGKFLEVVPVDETSLLIRRAIEDYETTRAPQKAADSAGLVAAVFEKLGFSGPGANGPMRVQVVQDEADKTKGFGEWIQAISFAEIPSIDPARKAWAAETLINVYKSIPNPDFAERFAKAESNKGIQYKTALAESAGITGGYTVPTEYRMELIQFKPENNVMKGFTNDFPMTSRELKMPVLDQTTPSGVVGQSNYFAGVVAYWTAEAALRQESEPKFRELTLVANELSGYALASRNVLMDNRVALEMRLTQLFGGAVNWYMDYAYLVGDGVGKPRGVLGSAAALHVDRAVANQVNYADVTNMYGLLMPQSINTAYWVMQQSVLANFLQMADSNGRYVIQPYYPTYIPGVSGGPATVRPVMSMLGLPIKVTEKVPTLGTTGDVMLIDPMMYMTGMLQSLEIAASEHYKFLNNQVTYRFICRGDGESEMNSFFTLADNTTKISPFVVLDVHS